MSVESGLMTWLRYAASKSPQFVKLNPNVPETTHFRLDGGKLHINPVMTEEFLRQYAIALDRKETLAFVERRTDVYKMHYDLDVLDTEVWSEATIKNVLQEVRNAMAECFPEECGDTLFQAVVLTAPFKRVGELYKTGIHVVYPRLQVDSSMGLSLRKMAVIRMNRLQRRVAPQNAWDDVLDECVHVANGLRMVGQSKWSSAHSAVKSGNSKKMRPLTLWCTVTSAATGRSLMKAGRMWPAWF